MLRDFWVFWSCHGLDVRAQYRVNAVGTRGGHERVHAVAVATQVVAKRFQSYVQAHVAPEAEAVRDRLRRGRDSNRRAIDATHLDAVVQCDARRTYGDELGVAERRRRAWLSMSSHTA